MLQTHLVTSEDLEAHLVAVRRAAPGELEGLFGPSSVTWRVNREAALFLGAGRALLLQLAHPWVATAIRDHSTTLADPVGRFHRTFDIMFTLVFGSLDQAFAAARRLHRRHAAVSGIMEHAAGPFVEGSPYAANEAAALTWVHATLVETALNAHDLVLAPLEPSERDRYYDASRRLAAMYAIPEGYVPASWAAFQSYMADMLGSDTLTVTPAARDIARTIVIEGARRWLRPPRAYAALTARLVGPRLAAEFGLPTGACAERSARALVSSVRTAYGILPPRLRFTGPYLEALERLEGRAGPSLLTRASNRLWIGKPRLSGPARKS